MKASRILSTLAAALLMFVGANFVRADDGGKGNNGNNGNNNNNNVQLRLRTDLAGASIDGKKPEGNADFRNQNSRMRLKVEVENVNLPDGTVLTVSVIHAGASSAVGMITLNSHGNENELELDSQNGDSVPAIASGDMITVSNGATVILAGVF